MSRISKNNSGYTLIEVLIAVGVFALFAIGIYSGIIFAFELVYNARVRSIETTILNEQIEVIRNVAYEDIGIVGGVPSGVFERNVSTTRNGIDFVITRTIRNIDDAFDGTADGESQDSFPADYKLVDVEVICIACKQRAPERLTSYVGPKTAEGNPANGSLFVEVFDANADPVQGAEVHLVATSTFSSVDMIDTTDNDGMLRVFNLPAGVQAYDVTVTKSGYTSAMTRRSTAENENPIPLPASVLAQDVSTISFAIDERASLAINTVDNVCQPIAAASLHMEGSARIGVDPDVLLVDEVVTTDSAGNFVRNNLRWDAYALTPVNYDLRGALPALPLAVSPGADQVVDVVLAPDTAHSLVVYARDGVTQQPISGATVTIDDGTVSQSAVTGIGHIAQTDWSGGSGQTAMSTQNRYANDDGGVDVLSSPGDVELQKTGEVYVSSGWLESSTFDLGSSVNFVEVAFAPGAQPEAAGSAAVRFQLAASNSSTPASWEYQGPDGTSATYYTSETPVIADTLDGNQFLRYKAYLQTASSTVTPRLSDLSVSYTTSCTPPGQVYFADLNAQEYSIRVTADGYKPANDSMVVGDDDILTIDMVSL